MPTGAICDGDVHSGRFFPQGESFLLHRDVVPPDHNVIVSLEAAQCQAGLVPQVESDVGVPLFLYQACPPLAWLHDLSGKSVDG